MFKKIIIKNILKITPLITGIILFIVNKLLPIGISLLFIGGYIILKNTLDYRQLNKNIKEKKYLKSVLLNNEKNKTKSKDYQPKISFALSNNLCKEKTINGLEGYEGEISNTYSYNNEYQTEEMSIVNNNFSKIKKRVKNKRD